ncbi:MAG: hypothetical protein A3B68_03400 [Candidatus Melainabacteria bacterium RIFCSPHIGHO2_02_FULL_34_12]|nr:MAG: hypothetical protein A3B68_03400 [Candidatus Melainabacteria bacterium RIFCSPHIGHO2_02_FULL_34_12]
MSLTSPNVSSFVFIPQVTIDFAKSHGFSDPVGFLEEVEIEHMQPDNDVCDQFPDDIVRVAAEIGVSPQSIIGALEAHAYYSAKCS